MSDAASDLRGKTLLACAFQAPEPGAVDYLERALIAIDARGVIVSAIRQEAPDYRQALASARATGALVEWDEGAFCLPGFVDLHVHAPQYPQLGAALDAPLEVWLNAHTFPLEARYADLAFAQRSYDQLVRDLLANGTTTALYFATIHQDATRALADICIERGQRALIGRVAMDDPTLCPAYYRDASAKDAVSETRSFIDYVRAHPANGSGLVAPVITPRFIPACTDAALEGLGALARECGCHVQTHVSESDWEHGYVLHRHGMTDTRSLDRFGLIGRHSVLAHGVFLTPDDMTLIATRQAGIAHCPASNAYFANAIFPLRAAMQRGLNVGLGTDISGGPSVSLFDSCRAAILSSRLLESGVDPSRPAAERGGIPGARIDFREAFYLATAGGAKALDLPVGAFAPGLRFDAMRVDTRAERGGIRLWEELDQGESVLQKILYGATRANIDGVWVDGRQVG